MEWKRKCGAEANWRVSIAHSFPLLLSTSSSTLFLTSFCEEVAAPLGKEGGAVFGGLGLSLAALFISVGLMEQITSLVSHTVPSPTSFLVPGTVFRCGNLCDSSALPSCYTERGKRPSTEEMGRVSSLLTGLLLIFAASSAERFFRSGPRVCSVEVRSRAVSYLTSYAQPVYQPYLTMCPGTRLCSTYRTVYRVAQRLAYRKMPQPAYTCCPGWKRAGGHSKPRCNTAICRPPCQHGGKCLLPYKCACPLGWTGRSCQADVDECAGGRHDCDQDCLNVAGSYRCACQPGYKLHADGKTCHALEMPTDAPITPSPAGVSNLTAQDEVEELRNRVVLLEEKLELALAPFLKVDTPGLEGIISDPISLLTHSLQQLDRIDSLSEQISFLEERLETCSCKNGL